jgi:hypothetical protein
LGKAGLPQLVWNHCLVVGKGIVYLFDDDALLIELLALELAVHVLGFIDLQNGGFLIDLDIAALSIEEGGARHATGLHHAIHVV